MILLKYGEKKWDEYEEGKINEYKEQKWSEYEEDKRKLIVLKVSLVIVGLLSIDIWLLVVRSDFCLDKYVVLLILKTLKRKKII